jgi:Protein of unknown function (DUF2892)
MKENLGNTDKIVRIFLGLIIVLLGVKYGSWWGALGMIFPITAVINWCPIYAFFGLRSNHGEQNSSI